MMGEVQARFLAELPMMSAQVDAAQFRAARGCTSRAIIAVLGQRRRFSAGLCALLSCTVLAQGNLGFLKDAPIAYFDQQDMKLLHEAVDEVLSSAEPQTSRSWQNPATGSSGKIEAVARFNTEDGRECRALRIQNHAVKGGDGLMRMNMCRSAGGKWRADPDARPAPH
jgi:surface antigen